MDFIFGLIAGFFVSFLSYCLGWYHGDDHNWKRKPRNLNLSPPLPEDTPTNRKHTRTMWD